MKFSICLSGRPCKIITETSAFEGVVDIARTLAEDIELVCDCKPSVITCDNPGITSDTILVGTCGHSEFLNSLRDKGLLDDIIGKRECYKLLIIDAQDYCLGTGRAMIVAGSDKRGTIYGLFEISRRCGVSPLVYWGDVKPVHMDDIILELDEPYTSKEPSVKYRGLFINDELPCFGNWAIEKFGGVNAKVYDKVFKLLLRLNGNYMWPAMWFEIFSEEGPGLLSARLADKYGIIMGTSHHEPCCRAGAEWQKIYSRYGEDNTWSYMSNTKAITDFWRDGLIRNRDFENIITIGMRGEDDSLLLGENATLKDNIDVLKKAILAQHDLIRETISPELDKVNRMLAIYKEVEGFYYGDETCEGLKDWEELKDVIFLLSDDNFGNTRGLPTEAERNHPGGFGMYYHFDYHGGPISYEAVNCTRLSKVWEQMTLAYEYGVRELWIVNVGDIKNNEFPLCYFMDLAYDYEKWSRPGSIDEYMNLFMDNTFGNRISSTRREEIIEYIDLFTGLNAIARPETVKAESFAAASFGETRRLIAKASRIIELGEKIHNSIEDSCRIAFDSMFYYQGQISASCMLMNLYAGLNLYYAMRGSLAANDYSGMIEHFISKDRELVNSFHIMLGGKWNHMMSSAHTGFRSWNDDIWCYPSSVRVYPIDRPKVLIGFDDSDNFHKGSVWTDHEPLESFALTKPGVTSTVLNVDLRGRFDFDYEIVKSGEVLNFSSLSGHFDASLANRLSIIISCDRKSVTEVGREEFILKIRSAKRDIPCDNPYREEKITVHYAPEVIDISSGVYKEFDNIISIRADHYISVDEPDGTSVMTIKGLGLEGNAIRFYPVTTDFLSCNERPYVTYMFDAQSFGRYTAYFYVLSRNPVVTGEAMSFDILVNSTGAYTVEVTDSEYRADLKTPRWCEGALSGRHITAVQIDVIKGLNYLSVYAGSPNISLEKIVLVKESAKRLPNSYLGPEESLM